jgi:DNA-binding transcriptional LysR family regulator
MDNVSGLTVFVRVADTGSFAAAGRSLGISASAVGKSVTRLEERVRARLLLRSTRNLTLTPEGGAFLERCRHIIAEIQAAEAELASAAEAPRGRLRVSLPLLGEPFLKTLSDFRWRYPDIELDLDFTNRNVDLVREGFDAAIRTGDLPDSTLRAKMIGTYKLVLVAAPDYLARKGMLVTPSDLSHHERLGLRLPDTGKIMPLAFSENWTQLDDLAQSALVVTNSTALIRFAVRGHGLAYVSDFLVRDEIVDGTLVPVLGDFLKEGGRFHIVWPAGRHVPPKLRTFIDHVTAHLMPK